MSREMNAFAAVANIVRMSDIDFEFLYGGSDYAGQGEVTDRGGVQAWSSSRAELRELRRGTKQPAVVEVQAPTVDVG